MIIGKIIKECRQVKNLTQEALAEKLNVTPQAVSRWENEISYPDIALVPRISRVLGISADVLLDVKGEADAVSCGDRKDIPLCQNDVDMIFGYVSAQDEANKGKRVLAVDDVPFMRKMLSDILTSCGFVFFEASGGKEALSTLKKERFDVVLLDINMPEMDGLEVLEKIKRSYPELPVVMLSARCDEETVRRALELGASGFVAKPFQASAVVDRISLF